MRLAGILGCMFAIALAAACAEGVEGPEAMPTPPASGFGGGMGVPPSKGGAGGPSKDGPVGIYTEEVVEADPAPPPIAGGTLAIIAQGTKAAIADPDHDQVVVIDLASLSVTATIPLASGDDPGRLIEDAGGRLHVALRAGRGVAVFDPTGDGTFARLPVCLLPRGLAYQYASDTVHVACAGGELVSYTAANTQRVRELRLPRDLRDVVIDGERLLVSRFRSAELLVVESDGTVSQKLVPPTITEATQSPSAPMKPAVAWRTVAAPAGGALMVHQYMSTGPIATQNGGYGGGCRRILTTAVSWLRTDAQGWTVDAIPTVLSVDVAATADGSRVAVPGAGRTPLINFVSSMPYAVFSPPQSGRQSLSPCGGPIPPAPLVDGAPNPEGRVVAVAFDPIGRLALQTREPAVFHLGSRSLPLPGRSRKHTGHELFHLATAGGIACASCHPEGRDDGQVWNFADLGNRRTQSLAGGIRGTEPFHWAGDMTDFNMLAAEVFSKRMSGPRVEASHTASLLNWIDKIPRLPSPATSDAVAAARGLALFNDSVVGCASCHSGTRFTNSATVAVNTGGLFQVPSLLGIAWRAPYMHQGCAATLDERFGPCGGGDSHGKTSHLTTEQRSDLVAYLETL